MNTAQSTSSKELFGHPRGLYVLFMTEMWERFSFYGIKALLLPYMVAKLAEGGLGWETSKAGPIFGLYAGSAYLVGLAGGWIADNFLGARNSVYVGGLAISAGNVFLALGSEPLLYAGLTLIALGTGLLKTNVSTMVGALYSEKDPRRDSGFSIFYMGINTGALLAPIVVSYLALWFGWRFGFWASAVAMILGLVQYRWSISELGDAGKKVPRGRKTGIPQVVEPFTKSEWFRLGAIGVFFLFSATFWAAFEQSSTTLNLFASDMSRTDLFGIALPPTLLQSVNSIFIIALAPVFSALWLRLGPRQPSSPVKFSLGLAGASAGFWVAAYAASLTTVGRVSLGWLLLVYFFHSVGELCLSPVGLSMTTKLAPARIAGLMMGVWFGSIAAGNYIAGFVAGSFKADATTLVPLFSSVATVTLVAAVLLLVLTPFLKKLMGEVK